MRIILKLGLSLALAFLALIPVHAKPVYKITIDMRDGTLSDGSHKTVIEVEEGKQLGECSKLNFYNPTCPTGYGLVGYALGDNNDVVFNGEELSLLKPSGDMEIYGVYGKAYTITFDYNGSKLYGQTSDKEIVVEGCKAYFSSSVPDAPVSTEAFAGWSVDKYGEPQYSTNELENLEYTKNTTFYAIYKPAVTVTLEGNDGVFYPDEVATMTTKAPKGFRYCSRSYYPDKEDSYFIGWSTTKDGPAEYGLDDEGIYGIVFNNDTTLYAVYRPKVKATSYDIAEELTMHAGETVPWPLTIEPANADYAIISVSHDASVAKQTQGGITAYREGVAEIEYMFQSPGGNKFSKLTVTVLPSEKPGPKEFGFVEVDGKKYWYENWEKQGVYGDPKNIWDTTYDKLERGREIYDPESDGWYWLDAVYDGAAAYGKEVWIPYIYQNEDDMPDAEKRNNANNSDEGMEEFVYQCMVNKTGKWVRYDNNGKMLKGWVPITGDLAKAYPDQAGNTYYYDQWTGTMAKGYMTLDGVLYHFDENTGVLTK